MTDSESTGGDAHAQVRELLHRVSELLRDTPSLGEEGQQLLAELVEELSLLVNRSEIPSAELTHLTECVAHLVEVAGKPQPRTLLESARERLMRAVIAAETEAPLAAGIVHRLIDALANIGI